MSEAKELVTLQVCNGSTTGKRENVAVEAFLVLMRMTAHKTWCLASILYAHATRNFSAAVANLLLLQRTYAPRGCGGHLVV